MYHRTQQDAPPQDTTKPTSSHPSTNEPNQRSPTQFWQPRSIFAMDHASPHHEILTEIYRKHANQRLKD